MARRSGIRWHEDDEKELRKAVRNFNAKIGRVKANKSDIAKYQPEKVSIEDIKSKIETRADLNRELNALRRYSQRGAENIVDNARTDRDRIVTTQWQVNEVAIKHRVRNRYKNREYKKLKDLEVKSRGEGQGYSVSMQSEALNSLRPTPFKFEGMSKYSWNWVKENIDRFARREYYTEQKEQWRENYINGLYNVFGNTSLVAPLIEMIRGIDLDKFVETFVTDREATFDWVYDREVDGQTKLEALYSAWGVVYKEHDDDDFYAYDARTQREKNDAFVKGKLSPRRGRK